MSDQFGKSQPSLTPDFFSKYKLTPMPVTFIIAWTIEEANKQEFDRVLLAIVRMADDRIMVVHAGRERYGGNEWVMLGKLANTFQNVNEAIKTLHIAELHALGLYKELRSFKCSWCELVFKEGVDTHHALMIRVSNKLSIDETLCEECIKYVYERIQPIMEGRIQRQAPRKGRNIIL